MILFIRVLQMLLSEKNFFMMFSSSSYSKHIVSKGLLEWEKRLPSTELSLKENWRMSRNCFAALKLKRFRSILLMCSFDFRNSLLSW